MSGKRFCHGCGEPTSPTAVVCLTCGRNLEAGSKGSGDRIIAGVLGIVFGALGLHKFILGYNREGVIMLLISIIGGLITAGLAMVVVGIIGIIEGIIYLAMSNDTFELTYVKGDKPWF